MSEDVRMWIGVALCVVFIGGLGAVLGVVERDQRNEKACQEEHNVYRCEKTRNPYTPVEVSE